MSLPRSSARGRSLRRRKSWRAQPPRRNRLRDKGRNVVDGSQGAEVQRGCAARARARREHPGRRGQGHLGPKGRYVVLDKKFGAPTITNDGVTIAREIEVEDVFENQ